MTAKEQFSSFIRDTFGVAPEGETLAELIAQATALAKAALAGVNPSTSTVDPHAEHVRKVRSLLDSAGLAGNGMFIKNNKSHLDNIQIEVLDSLDAVVFGFTQEYYREARPAPCLALLTGAFTARGWQVSKIYTGAGARLIASRRREVEQTNDEVAYG